MWDFVRQCFRNTGLDVQAWIAYRASATDAETYQSVTRQACGMAHFINPKSGKALGNRPTE
jgi:hypothetical protein